MEKIEATTELQSRAWHMAQAVTAAYRQASRFAAIVVATEHTGILTVTKPALYKAA